MIDIMCLEHRIYVSRGCDPRLADYFENNGYKIIPVSTSGIVAAPVSCHPDMFLCKMGISDDAPLMISPLLSLAETARPGTVLSYPEDIAYNAACTGKYFIHNLKSTAPEILAEAGRLGMHMIYVRQGYAKCSIVVVDEDSVITYDRGIEKACLAAGMHVLAVEPGNILLPGYDTGFIGGASGRIGDTVYFNGDLTEHPDFDRIVYFIEERGVKAAWFEEWPLTDIGSLISTVSVL